MMGGDRWLMLLLGCWIGAFVSGNEVCPYAECGCMYHPSFGPSKATCFDLGTSMPKVRDNYDPVDILELNGNVTAINKQDLPRGLKELETNLFHLDTISNDAFDNVAGSLLQLKIQFSNLTSLPIAIYNLKALKHLTLDHHSFAFAWNETVIKKIGKDLETFDIKYASSFPPQYLKYFQNLITLKLTMTSIGLVNSTFEDDMFDTIAHSLKNLELSTYNQDAFPKAISSLTDLESLNLYGFDLSAVGDLATAFGRSSRTLKSLEFENCLLPSDPTFIGFPALLDLSVKNTANLTLNGTEFPGSLTSLLIEKSNLKSFPAFRSLPHLTKVAVPKNNITSLTKQDLAGLRKLAQLNLDENQIGDLANDTFEGSQSMTSLAMSGNKLTRVPLAIARAGALQAVSMMNNPFKCPCTSKELHDWVVKPRDFFDELILSFPDQCVGGLPGVSVLFTLKYDGYVCQDSDVIG